MKGTMPIKRALAALFVVVAACAPATAVQVQEGVAAFHRGEIPAAMQRFVETEGDQGTLNAEGQVRYLVYRGLAAYRLGQKAEAKSLLAKGKRAYDAGDPRWLPREIADEMNKALTELGGP
ncbi:Hypothetical protein A7982_02416 [Minicystis rosea]|nr:Hypothetical protein A7982_02416 [Minicystis rosea]